MRPIRFGPVFLGLSEVVNPIDFAVQAEQWGYDSFWAPEILLSHEMDPLVILGAAAARTRSIQLGTGVVALPLWSAPRLAKAALSVEAISNGRLILGVGLGFSPQDCEFSNVDWHRRHKPADDTLEQVRRLTSATSAGQLQDHGTTNRSMLKWIEDEKRHIPVWVASSMSEGCAEGTLKRTARYGDCFFPAQASVEAYRSAQGKITQYAQSAGRDPSEIEWACMTALCLAENREKAQAMFEAHPFARHLQPSRAALGTVTDIIEYVEKFVAIGVRHFVFLPACDPTEAIEQFRVIAESVLPHYHARAR